MTDPSRPGGGEPDVMVSGDEREPWRASRRQKAVVAGGVAVALVVAGAVQVVRHQREQTRLDAASPRQVTLAVTLPVDDASAPEGSVRLAVRNDTPDPVHLSRLTVDVEGLDPVPLDLDLAPAQIGHLDVPDTVACDPALAATGLTVSGSFDVRTSRGRTGAVPVMLLSDAVAGLLGHAQDRCHYQPPDRALGAFFGEAKRVGDTLVVTETLTNQGLLDLEVTGYTTDPWLAVTSRPAGVVSLPPGTFDDNGTPVGDGRTVQLVFRVTDCAAARAAVLPDLDPTVVAFVRHSGGEGSSGLGVSTDVDVHPLADFVVAVCR